MAEVQRPKRKRLSPSAVFAADAEIDVVKDLLQKIEGMKREVDTLRTNLASTGDTVAENTALKADLEKFKADADDFSGLLDELSRRVAAGFGATLGEVINAIDEKKIITTDDVLKSVGGGSTGFIPAYLDLIRLYITSQSPLDKKNILNYMDWMEGVNRQRPEMDKVVPAGAKLKDMDATALSEFINKLNSPVLDYEVSRGTKGFIEPSANVIQYRENVIGNADSSGSVSAMQVEPESGNILQGLSTTLEAAVSQVADGKADATRNIWLYLKDAFGKLNEVGVGLADEYSAELEKNTNVQSLLKNPIFGTRTKLFEAFSIFQSLPVWGTDRRPMLIQKLVPVQILRQESTPLTPKSQRNCLAAIAMWTYFVGPKVRDGKENSDAWFAYSLLRLLNACPKDKAPFKVADIIAVIDQNIAQ